MIAVSNTVPPMHRVLYFIEQTQSVNLFKDLKHNLPIKYCNILYNLEKIQYSKALRSMYRAHVGKRVYYESFLTIYK